VVLGVETHFWGLPSSAHTAYSVSGLIGGSQRESNSEARAGRETHSAATDPPLLCFGATWTAAHPKHQAMQGLSETFMEINDLHKPNPTFGEQARTWKYRQISTNIGKINDLRVEPPRWAETPSRPELSAASPERTFLTG
jgi:hypothetical protein